MRFYVIQIEFNINYTFIFTEKKAFALLYWFEKSIQMAEDFLNYKIPL